MIRNNLNFDAVAFESYVSSVNFQTQFTQDPKNFYKSARTTKCSICEKVLDDKGTTIDVDPEEPDSPWRGLLFCFPLIQNKRPFSKGDGLCRDHSNEFKTFTRNSLRHHRDTSAWTDDFGDSHASQGSNCCSAPSSPFTPLTRLLSALSSLPCSPDPFHGCRLRMSNDEGEFSMMSKQGSGPFKFDESFDSCTSWDSACEISTYSDKRSPEQGAIHSISDELLCYALSFLDIQDLLNCATVSRAWSGFSKDPLSCSNLRFPPSSPPDSIKNLIATFHPHPHLEHLDLTRCRCINNKCLTPLSGIRTLQSLKLSSCSGLQQNCLEHFSHAQNLTKLELSNCATLKDNGIENLFGSPNVSFPVLKHLNLSGCKITDCALRLLSSGQKLPELEHLDISQCPDITVEGILALSSGCTESLMSLSLCGCDINDECVIELASQPIFRSLRTLDLSWNCCLTNQALKQISTMTSLENLNLRNCTGLSNQGVRKLANLSNLTALDLSGCHLLRNCALKELAKLERLEVLNLKNCVKIHDDGMCYLVGAKSLRRLSLEGCHMVTERGVACLVDAKSLNTIILGSSLSLHDDSVRKLSCKCNVVIGATDT